MLESDVHQQEKLRVYAKSLPAIKNIRGAVKILYIRGNGGALDLAREAK